MASFDYPHSLRAEYERRLRARVDAATRTVEEVLRRLEGLERARPATWDAAIREAENAYRRAFGFQENLQLAEQVVNGITQAHAKAWAEEFPETMTETLARLPADERLAQVKQQISAIKALVEKYYADLRDIEPDEDGFIVLATVGAAVAAKRGIAERRAKFYATDQAGNIYQRAGEYAHTQAGVDGFIWLRTVSANPRDRHLARVGQFFRWGEVSDEPGDLEGCKCGFKPSRGAPSRRTR